MNVNQRLVYDYLFCESPYRHTSGKYRVTTCFNSVLYKTIKCLVTNKQKTKYKEYVKEAHENEFLKNILNCNDFLHHLIKRNISYAACVENFENPPKHVCDIHLIMIGSTLEKRILDILHNLLGENENALEINTNIHQLLTGTYISNGCLYYSVFREVNNNTICYEMGANKEITFYLYDKDYNRGHKFFLDENNVLLCNNRDGNTFQVSDPHVLELYYRKCTQDDWHPHIAANLPLQIDYMKCIRYNSRPVDSYKNKRYLCFPQSVQVCWDKLNLFDNDVMDSCRQLILRGFTIWGISHMLSYEPSKSEYNKNYNKRMMIMKMNDQNDVAKGYGPSSTVTNYGIQKKKRKLSNNVEKCRDKMGSAEHKNGIIYKSNKNKEQSISLFVQVNHSHFHNLASLQMTAQKLQCKHVYAPSARNVPKDSFGYICCKYIGNIGTAGKNMLFTDGVILSYGHEDLKGIKIFNTISNSNNLFYSYNSTTLGKNDFVVVTNNIITKYAVSSKIWSKILYSTIVKKIKEAYEFAEILFWINQDTNFHSNFICINMTTGIAFRKFAGLSMYNFQNIFLSRAELEQFYQIIIGQSTPNLVEETNQFLCNLLDQNQLECSSSLAKCVNSKTEFTLPPKRAVAVNAYKSSIPNKVYALLSQMIHKNFQIYVDPEAFERDEMLKRNHITNRFDMIRDTFDKELKNESNIYYFNTAFGDVNGLNVEDAYVLDENINLHLWCILSYSLTFEEPPDGYVSILLPSIRQNTSVIFKTLNGEAVQFAILLGTIFSNDEITFPVFKNVCILKSNVRTKYLYTVYAIISDEILVKKFSESSQLDIIFDAIRLQTETFECFKSSNNNKYRRIDFVGVFKSRHFNGIKIVNAFGQKGLATATTDLSKLKTFEGPKNKSGDCINLIANNCSLISRCASGELLQMKQNFPCTTISNGETQGIIGRVPFFITDNLPSLSTAPMRFDEMQKIAYIANSLALSLNIRANSNMNNIEGLCYPRDSRHVLNLYESIINSSFRMHKFNESIYTTVGDINATLEEYEKYKNECNSVLKCMKSQTKHKNEK